MKQSDIYLAYFGGWLSCALTVWLFLGLTGVL
jgi:hypothetical protein